MYAGGFPEPVRDLWGCGVGAVLVAKALSRNIANIQILYAAVLRFTATLCVHLTGLSFWERFRHEVRRKPTERSERSHLLFGYHHSGYIFA